MEGGREVDDGRLLGGYNGMDDERCVAPVINTLNALTLPQHNISM